MSYLTANPQLQTMFQLILAMILGGVVGLEREWKKKEAGLRTYMLVCLGSALFTIIGFQSLQSFVREAGGLGLDYSRSGFDPSRVIGQIVLGIGFLGSGLIIFRQEHVEGLTTAAGLWVTAGVGAAVGLGFYTIATFSSVLSLLILFLFRRFEKKIFGIAKHDA